MNFKDFIKTASKYNRYSGAYIYFLLHENEVVYIGKSTSLACRIVEHINSGTKTFDDISVIECAIDEMDALEIKYINEYCPKYNKESHLYRILRESVSPKMENLKDNVTREEYQLLLAMIRKPGKNKGNVEGLNLLKKIRKINRV